jgi:hypothetical protein
MRSVLVLCGAQGGFFEFPLQSPVRPATAIQTYPGKNKIQTFLS